jgi:hypothetical protein
MFGGADVSVCSEQEERRVVVDKARDMANKQSQLASMKKKRFFVVGSLRC